MAARAAAGGAAERVGERESASRQVKTQAGNNAGVLLMPNAAGAGCAGIWHSEEPGIGDPSLWETEIRGGEQGGGGDIGSPTTNPQVPEGLGGGGGGGGRGGGHTEMKERLMHSADWRLCGKILDTLVKKRDGQNFLVPALELLPLEEHGNYSSIVKKPLDLGIVCRRFRDGYYSKIWQLGDDVRLVYRERERD
jgi:hypothetical protein